MRIVIDMQGAQTGSRFRGIGRYTLSLVKAVVRNRGEHQIILALNGMLPDSIEYVRDVFKNLLPEDGIRVWYAPHPVNKNLKDNANAMRHRAAELIREAFLSSFNPDVILITSLFEGFDNNAVTGIGLFDDRTPVAVILYDLIPFLYPDTYLKDISHRQYYMQKINFLKQADLCLAISKSSAAEAEEKLSIDKNRIINISAACDSIFEPLNVSLTEKKALFKKFGIKKSFIMYTGGADDRKNLDALIGAFKKLPDNLIGEYQIVIAGKMLADNIISLNKTAKSAKLKHNKLIFTGYVSDLELVKLYNLCALFVFPSKHEGFGLPVLEAMSCGRPVIASNTSSLPEIIIRDDMMFDPLSEMEIAQKITEVLTNDKFANTIAEYGLERSKNFSWDISAQKAIKAFEDIEKIKSEGKGFGSKFNLNSENLKKEAGNINRGVSGKNENKTAIIDNLIYSITKALKGASYDEQFLLSLAKYIDMTFNS